MIKKFCIVIIAAASLCSAQSRTVDKHGAMMAEGRPFITDGGLYNSYDLGNSPLGMFDIDSSRFSAEVGYGYLGLRDIGRHDLSGQKIRMGEPGRAFFEVFYGPDFLSYKDANNLTTGASLPLHRFGLTLATQTESGFFGAALSADGYIGTQTWDSGDSSRTFMGLDRLRLDFGSQVHPLVRIGLFFGVTAHLDTLMRQGQEDVSFQMNFPEFGGSIDFGGEDMPVRSNLYAAYSFSRFIYRANGTGNPPVINSNQVDAIRNDSLNLFWMAQGRVPINDDYTVKPGLLFGYTGNFGDRREPKGQNDNPLDLGNVRLNSYYSLTGVWLGLGTGFEALKYADLHIEYAASLWSLSCGAGFLPPPAVTSRTLHHTTFGVSTPLHEYVDMPVKVFPRIAYFISGSSGIVGSRWSDVEPLNIAPNKSKAYLYSPQNFLAGFTRISGFTIGVDGAALEDMLSASLWVTFLSSKNNSTSQGGTELGLSAGFRL